MRAARLLTVLNVLAAFALASRASATSFYVAPSGRPSGAGSIGDPWNLATALDQPSAVHPGDRIWLRGGIYSGTFTSWLTGTSVAPIIVRQYPGERATIDGGNSNGAGILTINGAYTWYWGFEITSSSPDRVSTEDTSWPTDMGRGDGVDSGSVTSPGIKLINLVIHDTRQGVSAFLNWVNSEIYGCLIYYNGWQNPSGGAGHAIYTQNQSGTKRIVDNIVFSGFSHGLHAYTENGQIDNLYVAGNTFFNNGVLAPSGGRNFLLGGLRVASNPQVLNNSLYYRPGGPVSSFDMGYSAGCSSATVTGNYVADNTYFVNCVSGTTMTGNTFYGTISGFSPSQFPSNTYFSLRPTGVKVLIRPNAYEAGRANITVYNWNLQSSVNVDLSGVLPVGSQYEIRNAQNFFASPVRSGTYAGGTVSLPMTALTVASPVGWPPPPTTGAEFQAFVLIQTASPPPSAMSFYTVAPCRVVDTRGPTGPLGGPALASGAIRRFTLANQCGIPSTAKAISTNVTVTQATRSGFLTVFPGGTLLPLSSSINYTAGRTRANNNVAALGVAGDVNVYNGQTSGTVHLILDVNGYFQ